MNRTGPSCSIRDEGPHDAAAIAAVIAAAFGETAEVALVADLRAVGALSLSLVAEAPGGAVIGHVAFSPVTVDDAGAGRLLGLAPLAVLPAWQRRGVGSALVAAGLQRAAALGADLAFVLGDPAYYRHFGFRQAATLGIAWEHEAPAEAFMAVELRQGAGAHWRGVLRYHQAFDRFLP